MNKSEVVILAGGFGTRMSESFPNIPKPLIPINNIPVLEHLINECKKSSKREILLSLKLILVGICWSIAFYLLLKEIEVVLEIN